MVPPALLRLPTVKLGQTGRFALPSCEVYQDAPGKIFAVILNFATRRAPFIVVA
jgi:hypothetical protein